MLMLLLKFSWYILTMPPILLRSTLSELNKEIVAWHTVEMFSGDRILYCSLMNCTRFETSLRRSRWLRKCFMACSSKMSSQSHRIKKFFKHYTRKEYNTIQYIQNYESIKIIQEYNSHVACVQIYTSSTIFTLFRDVSKSMMTLKEESFFHCFTIAISVMGILSASMIENSMSFIPQWSSSWATSAENIFIHDSTVIEIHNIL